MRSASCSSVSASAGVDGVEVDARLAAQRLPEPVRLAALAGDPLGLAIPAQRLVEAAVQAGDVAQVDQQRRVALQRLRRQAVDPGCQRVELAGAHQAAPKACQQQRPPRGYCPAAMR